MEQTHNYKIRAGNELSDRKCATGLNATLVVLATVKMLASAPRHNKFLFMVNMWELVQRYILEKY